MAIKQQIHPTEPQIEVLLRHCARTAKENHESQVVFSYQVYRHNNHADINAAKNILATRQAVAGHEGFSLAKKNCYSKYISLKKRQSLNGFSV